MLYYLSKSVNNLQDWDLAAQLKNKANNVRLSPVFTSFSYVLSEILFTMARTNPAVNCVRFCFWRCH